MTDRFTLRKSMYSDERYVIDDSEKKYTFSALPKHKAINFCKVLNSLDNEIKQLLGEKND